MRPASSWPPPHPLAFVQLLALVPPVRRWALLMRDRTR